MPRRHCRPCRRCRAPGPPPGCSSPRSSIRRGSSKRRTGRCSPFLLRLPRDRRRPPCRPLRASSSGTPRLPSRRQLHPGPGHPRRRHPHSIHRGRCPGRTLSLARTARIRRPAPSGTSRRLSPPRRSPRRSGCSRGGSPRRRSSRRGKCPVRRGRRPAPVAEGRRRWLRGTGSRRGRECTPNRRCRKPRASGRWVPGTCRRSSSPKRSSPRSRAWRGCRFPRRRTRRPRSCRMQPRSCRTSPPSAPRAGCTFPGGSTPRTSTDCRPSRRRRVGAGEGLRGGRRRARAPPRCIRYRTTPRARKRFVERPSRERSRSPSAERGSGATAASPAARPLLQQCHETQAPPSGQRLAEISGARCAAAPRRRPG